MAADINYVINLIQLYIKYFIWDHQVWHSYIDSFAVLSAEYPKIQGS